MALLTYCYSFLQHNNLSLFYASNTKDQWKWFGRNQKQRIHNHYVYVCECCECSKFIELQNNFNKFSIILHALPTQRHKNAHTISVKSPVRCSSMKHMDQYFLLNNKQNTKIVCNKIVFPSKCAIFLLGFWHALLPVRSRYRTRPTKCAKESIGKHSFANAITVCPTTKL